LLQFAIDLKKQEQPVIIDDKKAEELLNSQQSIEEINKILQSLFLRDKRILLVKNIKMPITDKTELEKINLCSDKLFELFEAFKLITEINNTNKKLIHQVRFLGTNHILFKMQVEAFIKAVSENKIILAPQCKILLLGGDHINKGFKEDKLPEIQHMRNIIKDKFSDNETLNSLERINIVPDKTLDQKIFGMRVNTVDTVKKTNEKYPGKTNENILYVGYQPFLSRAINDMKANDKCNYDETNCYAFGPSVYYAKTFLENYKENKYSEQIARTFNNLILSNCFDNLARIFYTKCNLLRKNPEIFVQQKNKVLPANNVTDNKRQPLFTQKVCTTPRNVSFNLNA
jgi:hypothetical protein